MMIKKFDKMKLNINSISPIDDNKDIPVLNTNSPSKVVSKGLMIVVVAMITVGLYGGQLYADYITPISASASSTYGAGANAWQVEHMINSTGLTIDSAVGTHDGTAANMWMNDGGTVADEWVIFDLGQQYLLKQAYVWNDTELTSTRNVRTMDIYVSSDNITYTKFGGTVTLAVVSGATVSADIVPLATTARYVKFDILTNGGAAGGYVGLSEVRFESDENDEGVGLSDIFLAANNPPGTFVGNVTNDLFSSGNDTFTFNGGTHDSSFQILPTGNAAVWELRSDAFLASGNYDLVIQADNNSGNTFSGNIAVFVIGSVPPLSVVSADTRSSHNNGDVIATVISSADGGSVSYSLTAGRTDLMTMSGANILVANASSWGAIGSTSYVTLQIDHDSQSSSHIVAVEVKQSATGTIFRFY